jgi:hypothetical protein
MMDYIDWSVECFRRRLTSAAPPPYHPPLYPIPGARPNRLSRIAPARPAPLCHATAPIPPGIRSPAPPHVPMSYGPGVGGFSWLQRQETLPLSIHIGPAHTLPSNRTPPHPTLTCTKTPPHPTLTCTPTPPHPTPPPGEHQDARGARQSIFSRLSQRVMGLAGHSTTSSGGGAPPDFGGAAGPSASRLSGGGATSERQSSGRFGLRRPPSKGAARGAVAAQEVAAGSPPPLQQQQQQQLGDGSGSPPPLQEAVPPRGVVSPFSHQEVQLSEGGTPSATPRPLGEAVEGPSGDGAAPAAAAAAAQQGEQQQPQQQGEQQQGEQQPGAQGSREEEEEPDVVSVGLPSARIAAGPQPQAPQQPAATAGARGPAAMTRPSVVLPGDGDGGALSSGPGSQGAGVAGGPPAASERSVTFAAGTPGAPLAGGILSASGGLPLGGGGFAAPLSSMGAAAARARSGRLGEIHVVG